MKRLCACFTSKFSIRNQSTSYSSSSYSPLCHNLPGLAYWLALQKMTTHNLLFKDSIGLGFAERCGLRTKAIETTELIVDDVATKFVSAGMAFQGRDIQKWVRGKTINLVKRLMLGNSWLKAFWMVLMNLEILKHPRPSVFSGCWWY